jgi:hypothetical protein
MLWPAAVVAAAAAVAGEVEDGVAAVIRDPVVVVFPGLAAAVIRDQVVVIILVLAVAIILVLGAVIILARPPVAIARPPVATLIARASNAPTETTRMLIVAVAGAFRPTRLLHAQNRLDNASPTAPLSYLLPHGWIVAKRIVQRIRKSAKDPRHSRPDPEAVVAKLQIARPIGKSRIS